MAQLPTVDHPHPIPLPQLHGHRSEGPAHADAPRPSSPLTATVRRGTGPAGAALLDALAPEWAALCAEVAAEPFLHPDWLRADLATRSPADTVVLVTARRAERRAAERRAEAGRRPGEAPLGEERRARERRVGGAGNANGLRAVLPLVEERVRILGLPLTRWRSLGPARFPERFDLLCRPADRGAAAAAVWAALRAEPGWDLLELAAVPHEDPRRGPGRGAAARALLAAAAADGAPTATRPCLRTRVLPLGAPGEPPGLDVALAGASTKLKADLRRARRKLEQRGPVELLRVERADDPRLAPTLDAFLAIEAAGWKGRAATAIASDPATEAFFRRVAHAAADHGWLALYALTLDGRPVAAHLGLEWPTPATPGADDALADGTAPRTYAVPKLAHDEALAPLSPGSLLVLEVIHDLVARGVSTLDLLAQDDPWKARWTAHLLPSDRLLLFPPTPRGRLAHLLRLHLSPAANLVRRRLPSPKARSGGPEPALERSEGRPPSGGEGSRNPSPHDPPLTTDH